MRKTVIILSILLFLASGCNPKTSSTSAQKATFHNDTLLVNGLQLIETSNEEDTTQFFCLTTTKGDTIIPFANYYSQMELLDINEDGSTDIRVFTFSNTDNQCNNYLFDKKDNIFRLIENCDLDIQKINGTDFYYSYVATTCGKMNWESDLNKIENYQLVTYGRIYGNACDSNYELTIKIYKISGEDELLIKTLPYKKYILKFGDKWDFIKNYWETNYQNFE